MFGFGKKKEELATDEEVQQLLTGGRVSTEEMARLREAMREQGLMPDSQAGQSNTQEEKPEPQTEDADSEIAGRDTLAQCIEFHQKNGEPDVAALLTKLSNDKQCVILAAEARSFAVKFMVEDDYGLRDLEADIGKLARKIRETMSNPIEVKVMAASVGAFMFRLNSALAVDKEEDEEQKDMIRKFFHTPITVFHSIVLE
ncbi:hypothetical protein NLY09_09185 (plasmid) [Burkholderia vietnamiensis]